MASSLSDKAIFIYDTFFSANITQGQLDSQIKQSSLFRLAFEEVISYPNLLDKMKAHDRYDELIGINTEAYQMISDNATREENSQLEANCFLFLTNEENNPIDFSAFLKTVSGHIGFGKIINNPKTSYDIAQNAHAVDLILSNSTAIDALLNSPNGLNSFGKNPTSQLKIYQQEEVFKSLRASIRFNQEGVAPSSFSTSYYDYFKKHGDKYIYIRDSDRYIFISDDMYNWTRIDMPNDSTGNAFVTAGQQHHGDQVAYDHINKAWFFISKRNNARLKWTKDFVNWVDVIHNVGSSHLRTISEWDDRIWFWDYNSSNQWQLSYIQMQETDTYSPIGVANPPSQRLYGKAPEDPEFPYMIWTDVNYVWTYMDKKGDFPYRVKDQSDWFYGHDGGNNRTTRGITYANGYFFITFGSGSSMGITRLDLQYNNNVLWEWNARDVDTSGAKVTYWYNSDTNNYMHVSYANGVYIIPITGGYATSVNGVVWDEQLYDVTYAFLIKGADERGFYGVIPGTNFVITSYDASQQTQLVATTTSTTTVEPTYLEEGITELECLIDTTEARVVEYNGFKMVFNDKDYYENTNYVVTNGQYKILNVPEQYPIAVLNYGKSENITYTGDLNKKHFSKTVGTDADHVYDFFYGDVTINVKGNFENVSLYYYKKPGYTGYLGMEKILVHQDYLLNVGTTASDNTSKVSDTSIYAASIKNFDCVGNEALEQTDLTTIPTFVTPTTTTTPVYSHVFDPQTTTTSTTVDLGDQNYTTPIPLTPIEYDIILDGTDFKLQGQSGTFNALNSAGFRAVLRAGTYVFNAPVDADGEGVAIAFEEATSAPYFGPQHSNISYSGDFYKRSSKGIDGVPYYFYHGEIIVVVDAPFVTVNIVPYDDVTYNTASNAFSWDIVQATTPTTTAAPTTSTTTDSALTYTKCINSEPVITHDGTNVLFDGQYQSNIKHGMNQGTYIFKNVPQSAPIAILNYGKWSLISYTGEPMKSVTHTAADGHQYSFYYGDVTVNVNGDFGVISYETSTFNYSGGENKLIYSSVCPLSNIQTTSTTISPTTTTAFPFGLSVGRSTTTTTTIQPTTTSTTLAVVTQSDNCLIGGSTGNTAAYTGGVYVFNGVSGVYGMTTGTYVFKNVSASHPIAFHNFGKTTNITYDGQYSQGTKLGLDGNSYSYYYGDVTVTVNGDFGLISYECWYHGYMGGRNNLIYDNTNCT